jgi:DNA-binding MurR/RpiR family transcriptional regulator
MKTKRDARMPAKDASELTFDMLRTEIHARYDALSGQLQRIAGFALKDPNSMALGTVTEVASMCGVQPSSLVRFAKLFDLHGFSDLQRIFRVRLIEGAPALREQIERQEVEDSATVDSPGVLLRQLASASTASISQLVATVSDADLERAASMLVEADHIYVIAQRRAFPIAAYLAYGLWRLEMRAHLLDFVGGMVPQQVGAIRPQDLLVAISFEPYAPVVVEIVQDTRIRGIPTLTITDSPLGPIARNATLAFPIEDSHLMHFRPIAASICLAQTLILLASTRLERASRAR